MTSGLRVGLVGCGLVGWKRAEALRPDDELIGCTDLDRAAAARLADAFGSRTYELEALFSLAPDVVIVATTHDSLAPVSERALAAGAHVLVEKPAGLGAAQVAGLRAAGERLERTVKVGFNHRFHAAISRAAEEAQSGAHGDFMFLRARYGHGGRIGYDREWRADPRRSGGGELVDQGMHLLDLSHWIAGELPLRCALLRTHFWDTQVDDNAVLVLGEGGRRSAPWALLHVSWTEWKNLFSLEIYCRSAKIQVDGLARSYGRQTLRIYRMGPELGPPSVEEVVFGAEDLSWRREWEHFARVLAREERILGSLDDAHYAWQRIEEAYAAEPYSAMRASLGT